MKKTMIISLICSVFLCGCITVTGTITLPQDTGSPTSDGMGSEAVPEEDAGPEWVSLDEAEDASDTVSDRPEDLRDILIKAAGITAGDIACFLEKDFDKNGTYEAFAITGKPVEDYDGVSLIEGNVWYVGPDGAKKLTVSSAMGFRNELGTMTMGDTEYVMADEVYATSCVTHVYHVSDGEAQEAPFSAFGEVKTGLDGKDRFRIMDSSYDLMFDDETSTMTGHTWKDYYFFYDEEKGSVSEYGGTSITEDDIKTICARDLAGELIAPEEKISSIFLRGNGLIIINFVRPTEGGEEFYHYIYDIDADHLVDDYREESDEPQGGICLNCLCRDIASFPEWDE